MGYDNQPPGQQAQSNEPFFPVSKAVVFEGDARPGKHLFCILEAKAMLWRSSSGSWRRPIRTSFPFHHCNALCSYTQGGFVFNIRSEEHTSELQSRQYLV